MTKDVLQPCPPAAARSTPGVRGERCRGRSPPFAFIFQVERYARPSLSDSHCVAHDAVRWIWRSTYAPYPSERAVLLPTSRRAQHQAPSSYSKRRSEEHTSELQSHSFISYAVFCL